MMLRISKMVPVGDLSFKYYSCFQNQVKIFIPSDNAVIILKQGEDAIRRRFHLRATLSYVFESFFLISDLKMI